MRRRYNNFCLSILFMLFCIDALSQQPVTLDDMRQRYAEFLRQEVDTTISCQNDEVVKSTYLCYKKKGEKYNNPRMKNPDNYNYMLTERLRTPEYPDKRHYWSVVHFERVNHRGFNLPMKPLQRRRTKYKHKSFVRYLALDSIEGLGPSSWPKAFRKKYYRRKHNFHYAKAVSDSLFFISEIRNMLGYTVSPAFRDVVVRHGHIKDYIKSDDRCEEQMGELRYLGPRVLDGHYSLKNRINMRLSALNDSINYTLPVVYHPDEKKTYDLLIIMLPDGRADVEVLSCSGEVGPEFEPLRETIRKISPRFFVRYWMVDGQSLPGCYLKGILYEDGTWRFYMDKFLMQARWRVW